jgi:hypothetical protein
MDASLIAFLLDLAVKFTGLPAVPADQLPPLRAVSPSEMRTIACGDAPAGCGQIVALFDTDRYGIFYLDTLDLQDAQDNSFLLHEIVHVLQYRHGGSAAMYANCEALLDTEAQAYRAQNAYLRREGRLMQVGAVLQATTCAANNAIAAGRYLAR